MRRRQNVRHFRRALTQNWDRNITQRRLRASQNWHRWRSDIRHRSLIRIIGTNLPLKPPKRIRIHKHMLRPRRRHNSLDSQVSSSLSLSSSMTSLDDDRELVWVEEELGNNCVRVRAQAKDEEMSDSDQELDPDLFNLRAGTTSPMSSTMISSISTMSCDPAAMSKIAVLEDELMNLRQQIAGLVLTQEQVNRSQSLSILDMGKSECYTPTCPPVAPPPPPLPPSANAAGLPPIPPPPPILKCSTPTVVTEDKGKQHITYDVECQNIVNKPKPDASTPELSSQKAGPPSMVDVLKGLSSVKLRSIQRSPNGTPLKPRLPPLSSNDCKDPALLIAEALKKKFAHRQFNSPDVDKENDSHNFTSEDENSPCCNRENQFAKKTKRRSLLFREKRKSSGPLTELNV
ncbi:hypothetical protein KUTeg_016820 [Tegillarca granosa]|uniref:Mitochondrial fission regulator 2 n=1 Tax=Tegillarca granosa TaxID=220873 RepID=A0ABQ9EM85_TEGGR|nr:hypothetical protein KUTeg_016820 [Tegillarca granosa]